TSRTARRTGKGLAVFARDIRLHVRRHGRDRPAHDAVARVDHVEAWRLSDDAQRAADLLDPAERPAGLVAPVNDLATRRTFHEAAAEPQERYGQDADAAGPQAHFAPDIRAPEILPAQLRRPADPRELASLCPAQAARGDPAPR